MSGLAGKVAIVTGGASGIGAATVALLASRAVTAVPLRHVEALYERRLRVL